MKYPSEAKWIQEKEKMATGGEITLGAPCRGARTLLVVFWSRCRDALVSSSSAVAEQLASVVILVEPSKAVVKSSAAACSVKLFSHFLDQRRKATAHAVLIFLGMTNVMSRRPLPVRFLGDAERRVGPRYEF